MPNGAHLPSKQMALWHSSFLAQVWPSHFCGQLPLQSMPSSVPFLMPSVQVASAQKPSVHTWDGHSAPSVQDLGPASTFAPVEPLLLLLLLLALAVPLVELPPDEVELSPPEDVAPLEELLLLPPEQAAAMSTNAKVTVPY